MQLKLKLFLILICLIFLIFIYKKMQNNKLQVSYSLIWTFITLGLIFVTIFDNVLNPIKNFLGFETTSNMIFLVGFFGIALVLFTVHIKLSIQNEKITKLTQELAILEEKIRSNKK